MAKPARILIVDDDTDSLKLIGLMLQRQGYQVEGANTGFQALQKADDYCPHLIILDVMMPDMNGYEVCRRLRASPETGSIPIVMFTAKTLIDDKVSGFEAGADDYLTKPTHPAELTSRVKAILARSNNLDEFFEFKNKWKYCPENQRVNIFQPILLSQATSYFGRHYLFEKLASFQKEEFFFTLATLISSPLNDMRWLVARQLRNFSTPLSCAFLLTLLHDNDALVRDNASKSLGLLHHFYALLPLIEALSSQQDDVCRLAVMALGEYPQGKVIEPLIKILSHRSTNVVEESLRQLQKFHDKRLIQPFLTTLYHSEPNVQKIAGEGLLKLNYPVMYKPARSLLTDKIPWKRKLGIQILQNLKNREALPSFIDALHDAETEVQQAAVEALGTFNDSSAVLPLIALLENENTSNTVCRAAIKVLSNLKDDRALEVIQKFLADEDEAIRGEVVEVLNDFQNEAVDTMLLEALQDESVIIRGKATLEIAKRRHETKHFLRDTSAQDAFWRNVRHSLGSAAVHLLPQKWGAMSDLAIALTKPLDEQNMLLRRLAVEHPNAEVRIAALKGLGHNHHNESIDLLTTVVKEATDGQILSAALEALGLIGDEATVNIVVEAVSHRLIQVRFFAINALAMIGTPNAIQTLSDLLKSTDYSLRIDAIKAMYRPECRVPQATVLDMLSELAAYEENDLVMHTLATAFGELKSEKSIIEAKKLLIHHSPNVQAAAQKALETLEKPETQNESE